jgi:hypothetical protein
MKQTFWMTALMMAAGLAQAQSYNGSFIPQGARQAASDQLRYQSEMDSYRNAAWNARQSYQNCIDNQNRQSRPNPGSCNSYKNLEAYYNQLMGSMQAPVQRPMAAYPGQGMFPGPGQVARGVWNGIVNGQTQFPTDSNQMNTTPPVDYRGTSYAGQQNSGSPGLPYGGFRGYTPAPGYGQPPAYPQPVYSPRPQPQPQPYYPPMRQQPVYTAPVQPNPTPVLTYPPYRTYNPQVPQQPTYSAPAPQQPVLTYPPYRGYGWNY